MKGSELYTLLELATRRVQNQNGGVNAEVAINAMTNVELIKLLSEIIPSFTGEV